MTLADRLPHDRTLELAASAIDGHLTASEAAELETHLAACAACARTAAAMRTDAFALAQPLDLLPSRRVDDAVAAAIARHTRRSQRYVLLAVAALVLLAILGAIAVGTYLRRSADDKLPTTVIPTPPVAVISPQPDASRPVTLGKTWDTVAFKDGTKSRQIRAVASAGSSLVGVGRGECLPDFSDPTTCYGAAWTASADAGWTAAPNQPGLEMGVTDPTSGQERAIHDVTNGPAGLVAIGYDYSPPRSACAVAPCTNGPAVWRSADGQTWERVRLDLGPGIIDRFSSPVLAITADERRYVMVGYAHTLAEDGAVGAHAAAWTSSDGIDWTRAVDSDDMDVGGCVDTGEEPSCGGMRDVAPTANGYVAVGQALVGPAWNQARPAAWTSPDGLTWTRADTGLDFDGFLSGVAVGAAGPVAVGTICLPDCYGSNAGGVAVSSADGATWTSTPMTGAPAIEGIASTGPEYFAVGTIALNRPVPGPQAVELQLWRTVDGVVWRRETALPSLADVANFQGLDVVADASRVVIVMSADVNGSDGYQNFSYSSPAATASAGQPASSSAAARSTHIER
ncbi:MAG TPA: zf-HC2 domain-containing protein [Candidatus Limnocylindrales bacterium]|nr:zf-HC2 domain-containing protein [Candidatus Limnocylindrales bacterium]